MRQIEELKEAANQQSIYYNKKLFALTREREIDIEKRCNEIEGTRVLEVENRYLREIRALNDSFDAYKRQVEKHMA